MKVRRALLSVAFGLVLALVLASRHAVSFPVSGQETVLPVGTELNEDALDTAARGVPLRSHGRRANPIWSISAISPSVRRSILGGVARQAGDELRHLPRQRRRQCQALHSRACRRAPAISTPPARCSIRRPTTACSIRSRIPSLRGARYLAPYGHDGRIASLRDFVHNVIVNEFAGPEPSPAILDAIVAYIQDIDFLPNPSLGPGGRLTAQRERSRAARRSAVLQAVSARSGLSCAGLPRAVGRLSSIIGSTMSARAACSRRRPCSTPISTRPYFHDGRFDNYDQVVDAFRPRVRSRPVGAGSARSRRLSHRDRRRRAAL